MKKLLACFVAIAQLLVTVPFIGVSAQTSSTAISTSNESLDNSALLPVWQKPSTAGHSYTDSPEWLSTAVMAEVRLDTATPEGTLTAALKLLDYYAATGVNCLWIAPINEMGTDVVNNGYHNNGLHTIDLKLTEAETYDEGWANFAKFVEAAHKRNIYILLDTIMWGVDKNAPMKSEQTYSSVLSDTIDPSWKGYQYNYTSDAFKNYYKNTMLEIISETGIDGIRSDCAPAITGQTELLNSIRKAAFEQGNRIVIMSERSAYNDTTGTYDFAMSGVLDAVNQDYWDPDTLATAGFGENSDNYVININYPVNFWLSGKEGRDIVTSTKNGVMMSGTKEEQIAGTTGTGQYYSYLLSCTDYPRCSRKNLLRFGYQTIMAPVIPIWYMGDELGDNVGTGGDSGPLYYSGVLNTKLLNDSKTYEFNSTLRKYLNIRRTYSDIFNYYPENHRESNICKVDVSGISSHQAYARYRNGKAVMIIPNGTDTAAEITVAVPRSEIGVAENYSLKNLLTGETISVSNDSFKVTVAPGEMAIVLADDGTTATVGSEATVLVNNSAKATFLASAQGKTYTAIEQANNAESVSNARKAYDALTDAEKIEVTNYIDLVRKEKKISDIKAHSGNTEYWYSADDSSLLPNAEALKYWSWNDKILISDVENGGVRVVYTDSAKGPEYKIRLSEPGIFNNAHINLTLNKTDYWSNVFALRISNSNEIDGFKNTLGIKFDVLGNQIFFTLNGNSVDHSSMTGYNSGIATDRVFTTLTAELDIKFAVNGDGTITITVNGTDFVIKEADVSRATGISFDDSVFFYISSMDNGTPDYTLNYFHSGEDECYSEIAKFIERINAIGTVTKDNASEVMALLKEYSELNEEEKILITNKDVLIAAASQLNDSVCAFVTASQVSPDWWPNFVTRTDTETGVQIKRTADASNQVFNDWLNNAVSLDGAHIRLTLNSTAYFERIFSIKLSKAAGTENNGLRLRFDPDGGQLAISVDGKPIDHTGYKEYLGDPYFNRIVIPNVLNKNTSTYDVRFHVTANNSLIVIINGYSVAISSEELAKSSYLGDMSKLYFHIAPDGGALDYTLNCFHGGSACYDDIGSLIGGIKALDVNSADFVANALDLTAKYKALSADARKLIINYGKLESAERDMSDSVAYRVTKSRLLWTFAEGWAENGMATYEDTDEGVKIIHNASSTDSAFRNCINESVALNGAHIRLTLNSSTYNNRIFFMNLSTKNEGTVTEGLSLRFDPDGGQLAISVDGKPIDHTVYKEYLGDPYFNRIVIPNVLNKNTSTYDVRFHVTANNSLIVIINGYSVEISSEELAKSGHLGNMSKLYFHIAPDGGALDYTLNCFHGGEDVCFDIEAGDANCDYLIDIRDLVKLKKITAKLAEATKGADLNKDNLYDSLDLTMLRKMLLGI